MSTYIDVHILQDLPPSNVNRDDNGTPKQAVYGGVQRLRVSSQAWKRATRKHFEEHGDPADFGVRTRRLQGLLADLLGVRGVEADRAAELAAAGLGQLKITAGKKGDESSYLLFASRAHLEAVADQLAESSDPAEVKVIDLLGSTHSLDVALFGRMVADLATLNVDASAQVAHAISTHAAPTQFDYFVAVDDRQEKDEPGAGMIGNVEFNSATLYRFATVGLEQLVENMADREKAIEGIGRFITSFAESMPTGHQNSFAARTRPHLILVVVRADQPVSLVSAFERPVREWDGSGYVDPSMTALAETYRDETQRWCDTPRLVVASYAARDKPAALLAEVFGPSRSRDDLIALVTGALAGGGAGG